ncbi:MAG: FIST C-terminal domain-containing protein [Pseudomonadota bacterium]
MSIATALVRSHLARTELVHEAVESALDRAGLHYANAVLLFLSDHYAQEPNAALHEAARVAGCLQIDGCCAAGLFTESDQAMGEPAAAAMVFGGDIQLRHAMPGDAPVLSFAAPGGLDLSWLESGEARFGAIASDSDGQGPFRVWSSGRVQASGHCSLTFTGTRLRIGLTQGARPLSEPRPITRVIGHDIMAVGGKLALGSLAQALPQLGRAIDGMPLHLFMAGILHGAPEHALAEGRYQLLPILSANPDNGVVTVPAQLAEGDQLFWAVRQAEAAEQELRALLDRLGSETLEPPAFGLFFPCLGRGPGFYGGEDRDLALITERYPGLPLIGFYGNGEIARLNGMNRLLQYSAVLGLGYC